MSNENKVHEGIILVDGANYILNTEMKLKEQAELHSKQMDDLRKIQEEELSYLKKELQISKATSLYYKKMAEKIINKELNYKVEISFFDTFLAKSAGYEEKFTQTYKTFEEVMMYIDQKVYDTMDRHTHHTYTYSTISIKAFFINVDESMFSLELELESDSRIEVRDWESIIIHALDIKAG